LNTKRLPLPRLETYASRDIALQNLGDSVHFWPSRRKGSGRNTGEGADDPNGKGAQQKAQLQDELASLRAARGAAVASAQRSFGSAVDEAKKQVRASLAQLRADNRSRVKLDNASREMREIQRVQQIKADYNDLKHKRAQKEDQVKKLMEELERLGGDLEEDVNMLENIIPDRDRLQVEAVEQETQVEQETRKGSMYVHMQNRAKEGSEEASKEVDMLHMEAAALGRDLHSLEMYLRETRRLRAKSEEALNWMQENYNARSEEKGDRLARRREVRDQVGRELAETRIKMKELKAQWKLDADRQAMEEKLRQDQEQELVRKAEEREVAEEEMRVKLERLAHTVGLEHRPEGRKLGEAEFAGEEDQGWTPESIMHALQAVNERRDDCLRQIDKLRARERSLWESLPEWRTRLQAARQGWSDMWAAKLAAPAAAAGQLAIKGPPGATNFPSEEAQMAKIEDIKNRMKAATTGLNATREKYDDSVSLLSKVLTGMEGLERVITLSAPGVDPVSSEPGSIVPGISSEDAMHAREISTSGRKKETFKMDLETPGGPHHDVDGGNSDVDTSEEDDLQPFAHLGEAIHRVVDYMNGVSAAAEISLTDQFESQDVQGVAPVGVRPLKVKNPIGYIEEKDVPQKYTTKEGYAVAGPHLDVDDDNDADEKEDAKFMKKVKYIEDKDTPRTGSKGKPRTSMMASSAQ